MLNLGSMSFPVPAVMGILNVTPDSFSDGGRFAQLDSALRQAELMVEQGAAIIDVGGESTRPGAHGASEQQEIERVIPVIEAVRAATDIPISIDTSKALVMREAVAAGAGLINDVRALREDGALAAAAELQVPVCLMHMLGEPRTMQRDPVYNDVVAEVAAFLEERVSACVAAGIAENMLVVDPGIGFGKSPDHNVELLANLRQLRVRNLPLLAGVSRKSILGVLTGREIDERMPASLAAAVIAVTNGADIVRVHDVRETVDALRVAQAVMEAGNE
ncbi:MAG TPA: dihydropteroate synthase [Woeseiaceae bacterium]|jgi:dihydropteroate synthase|nr:dihydropteroate synthase [Woeseiaceae bacterium]